MQKIFLEKGFPKGGGVGGPTFGKNSQIIPFFFSAYLNQLLTTAVGALSVSLSTLFDEHQFHYRF